MSLTQSLNNAVSGLTASSRMAEVVSANLANVNTDGYGRRSLALSAVSIGGQSGGVSIDGIQRNVNMVLVADRQLAGAENANAETKSAALTRLETALGDLESDQNLSAVFTDLETALIAAAAEPSSDLRLQAVWGAVTAVADTLNANSTSIQSLRQDADEGIAGDVDTLNSELTRIQQMNSDIQSALAHGLDAASLMDQRQQAIDTVSEVVPIRVLGRTGGQVAIMAVSGTMLLDGKAAEIGFASAHTITPDMTLSSGGLSGLTVNGVATDPDDLSGGQLGAQFALRDEILPEVQTRLDSVAADLIARFESAGVDPSLALGQAGLFTDAGAPLDPADTVGLAGRITLNAAVDPDAGGEVFRLRDGVGATVAGPTGQNAQLNRWLGGLDGNGASASMSGVAADFVAYVGTNRVAADDDLSSTNARFSILKEAELSQGVDTDAELQTLLAVEQNYAANARLIQAVEEMMNRLMEI